MTQDCPVERGAARTRRRWGDRLSSLNHRDLDPDPARRAASARARGPRTFLVTGVQCVKESGSLPAT